MRTLLITCLALGGCLVDVDFGSGPFLCSDQVCDEGFECRAGRCFAVGSPHDAAPQLADAAVAPSLPVYTKGVANLEISALMANDDDASFSADRLAVVLNSNRGGTSDLWASTRTSIDDPWPPPELATDLSTAESESTVSLSSDGLAIVFGSARVGGAGAVDLYESVRASITAPWSPPVPVTSLNTVGNDLASWVSDDRLTFIFHTDVDGDYDLYVATRDTLGSDFNTPVPLTELNSPETDASGRFSAGGLIITFHSDRPGDGPGNYEIYWASRPSLDEPFSNIRLVEGINTAELEEDAWVSTDLCYIAYATRDENNDRQIFESTCLP